MLAKLLAVTGRGRQIQRMLLKYKHGISLARRKTRTAEPLRFEKTAASIGMTLGQNGLIDPLGLNMYPFIIRTSVLSPSK